MSQLLVYYTNYTHLWHRNFLIIFKNYVARVVTFIDRFFRTPWLGSTIKKSVKCWIEKRTRIATAERGLKKIRPQWRPFRKEVKKRLAVFCLWKIALNSLESERGLEKWSQETDWSFGEKNRGHYISDILHNVQNGR